MTKTLTVTIQDIEKAEFITLSGTLNEKTFNEHIVISVGQMKVSLNSKDLAEALKTVVDFQHPQALAHAQLQSLPLNLQVPQS